MLYIKCAGLLHVGLHRYNNYSLHYSNLGGLGLQYTTSLHFIFLFSKAKTLADSILFQGDFALSYKEVLLL
jgi:hypothetical protein